MSSATPYSRVVVRYAALALLVSCSYDLDRFARSGAGGASTTAAGSHVTGPGASGGVAGSGGRESTTGSTAGSNGGATAGSTGGSGGGATAGTAGGGATAGTAGGGGATAGTAGGGSGGAVGVGGGAGTSSAGAGGAVDAGSPEDSAPNDGGSIMGDEDVRDAAVEATSSGDATDSRAVDACMPNDCGTCTNTVECTCASYNGHVYRFCSTARSFSDAQLQCAVASMRLARVDDLFENAWIRSRADTLTIGEAWIGIHDPSRTQSWQWTDGTVFWMGDSSGSAVGGLFNAWSSGHPTGTNRNCASMMTSASSGQWFDRSCTSLLPYVCELY
jgi:hypothetical protein